MGAPGLLLTSPRAGRWALSRPVNSGTPPPTLAPHVGATLTPMKGGVVSNSGHNPYTSGQSYASNW
jgi:hypothetical protein